MNAGNTKIEREFHLFTKSGKPICNGKKFSSIKLIASSGTFPLRCFEKDLNGIWAKKKFELAETILKEKCEWRFVGNVETISL